MWSNFLQGIEIRTVFISEVNGLYENIQHFDSKFPGRQGNCKNLGGQSIVGHPVYAWVQRPWEYNLRSISTLYEGCPN